MTETNQAFKDFWAIEGKNAFFDNCKAWGITSNTDMQAVAYFTAWDAWLASRIAERDLK